MQLVQDHVQFLRFVILLFKLFNWVPVVVKHKVVPVLNKVPGYEVVSIA